MVTKNLGNKARLGAILALALLAGCDKKATGQVVAVVNGEEISQQELNAELQGQQVPPNIDKKAVMKQLLQRVIDRKLIVQAAKQQGLDKDPDYLAQQRRVGEELMVRMYAKKASDSIKIPAPAAIDAFIRENPSAFAERTRYTLDQVIFDIPQDPSKLKALQSAHSLDAVTTTLDGLGVKYARAKSTLDSATVPPELMKKILALPPTEPFVIPQNGKVFASVIIGKEALPLPPEQTRPLATQALRNKSLQDLATKQLKTSRDQAKIEYQPGFEPDPGMPGAGAAPAKAK